MDGDFSEWSYERNPGERKETEKVKKRQRDNDKGREEKVQSYELLTSMQLLYQSSLLLIVSSVSSRVINK